MQVANLPCLFHCSQPPLNDSPLFNHLNQDTKHIKMVDSSNSYLKITSTNKSYQEVARSHNAVIFNNYKILSLDYLYSKTNTILIYSKHGSGRVLLVVFSCIAIGEISFHEFYPYSSNQGLRNPFVDIYLQLFDLRGTVIPIFNTNGIKTVGLVYM